MKLSFKVAIIVLIGIVFSALSTTFLILPRVANLTLLLKILAILTLVVIPSTLIVWFLIHVLIIKPILNLNKVSKVIASGNLAQRIKIEAIDEIGELSYNFNTIINNLASGLQHMANLLRDEKKKEKQLADNYAELDKAKAKDEALLTSIGDAVIAIDDHHKIILFNKAASKMLGIDPIKVIGQPYNSFLKFFKETDRSPTADFISLTLKGEKLVENNRTTLQRFDGKTVPILHTTSPFFDSQDKIAGVVVVLKDITQERELEKLKDEFVSLASHELRTPMTAIKGLISMVFEGDYGEINPSLKDPLSDIAKSTDRLIQLVNDMLDVSRIEAGRTKFTFTEVSALDLALEVVGMLKPLAMQKNIRLEVSDSHINKVRADADKVKQILINLINNALKFTDHGSVVVSFRSYEKYAYISVTDSGIGITKENQARLFGKFSQVSTSQNGRPPGTGLGLYLSREFARKMDGEMWIEHSEEGKGSTFTFALPFAGSVI